VPFTCSICAEESTRICVRCTKDACDNHLCERCQRCSDCCSCEVRLTEPPHEPQPIPKPDPMPAEEDAPNPEPE
jgi:hypothetical protein